MRTPILRQLFSAFFLFDELTNNDADALQEKVTRVEGVSKWYKKAQELFRKITNRTPAAEYKEVEEMISLKLRNFPELCAAYGIRDLDILLDLCNYVGPDGSKPKPLLIPQTARRQHQYPGSSGAQILAVDTKKLKKLLSGDGQMDRHRTLMDIVTIQPGSGTVFSRHFGHEAVFVVEGKVEFRIEGNSIQKMGKHDYLSFNSMMAHAVHNEGTEPAVLVVARPMMSGYYSSLMPAENKLPDSNFDFPQAPAPDA